MLLTVEKTGFYFRNVTSGFACNTYVNSLRIPDSLESNCDDYCVFETQEFVVIPGERK